MPSETGRREGPDENLPAVFVTANDLSPDFPLPSKPFPFPFLPRKEIPQPPPRNLSAVWLTHSARPQKKASGCRVVAPGESSNADDRLPARNDRSASDKLKDVAVRPNYCGPHPFRVGPVFESSPYCGIQIRAKRAAPGRLRNCRSGRILSFFSRDRRKTRSDPPAVDCKKLRRPALLLGPVTPSHSEWCQARAARGPQGESHLVSPAGLVRLSRGGSRGGPPCLSEGPRPPPPPWSHVASVWRAVESLP